MKNVNTLKWLLTLACLLAALCAFTLAANAEIVDSGTCGAEGDGSNLIWTLDNKGLLTIIGSGEMQDFSENSSGYNYYTQAPWSGSEKKAKRIKQISFEGNITSIGEWAFAYCKNI